LFSFQSTGATYDFLGLSPTQRQSNNCLTKAPMERVAVFFEIPTYGSGPMGVTCAPNLANRSASSWPGTSECPGTQMRRMLFSNESVLRIILHSSTSRELTFSALSAWMAALLSEQILIFCPIIISGTRSNHADYSPEF